MRHAANVGEKSNFTHQDRIDTAVSRKGVIYHCQLPRITCPAFREAQLGLPHQSALCPISHAELRTCPGERKQKFDGCEACRRVEPNTL